MVVVYLTPDKSLQTLWDYEFAVQRKVVRCIGINTLDCLKRTFQSVYPGT